ncbi:tyrosine-type recombinase/integrase [Shinella sp.]|uniref:tyrosine-type recombinase/integrase n=1 Tax=Shinella sp. TaxID=1870904 RepID=UPI0028A24777|nr:tyrosine-type recombinase/integrase [Shinella sp.]
MDGVSKYVDRQPNGIYRYYRRVPAEVLVKQGLPKDASRFLKKSLKTKIHKEALERAEGIHRATNTLWRTIAAGNDNATAIEQYENAVKAAQSLGFTYRPVADLPAVNDDEALARLNAARANRQSRTVVQGVTGTAPSPDPRISDIWDLYEKYNKAGLTGLSPRQLAKHKVSRIRAINYLKDELKDAKLSEITRNDVLRFRDWWIEKIAAGAKLSDGRTKESLKAYSANRSFSDIKGMLTVIDDALHTNFRLAWDKVRLKETNATKLDKRLPFPALWVQDRILAAGALDNLNEDARHIIYIMAETGMRLGEVCNLRRQDIRLDDDVPHVEVAERTDRRQKTDYSIRRVPLVGIALWAAKQHPNGFPRYADKADSASAIINKILAKNGLRPTEKHTVYSLRHTFQDRIENADASDRMQADLMGHEFGRPTYGDGAEMKRRQEFLEGIKFNVPWAPPQN